LTVSTDPAAISGFTTDTEAIQQQIDSAPAGGSTALIDTVYLGLRNMRAGKQPRRALLVLSDGMDNHSRFSKSELMRVALEADVLIYSIIVDNPSTETTVPFRPAMIKKPGEQAQEREGRSLLEDLSDKTGGVPFRVGSAEEAKKAAVKVGAAIRNEYVIGYQASGSDTVGKWHRVRVKSDIPHASVYARNGYYAQ
jgi:Ca-activated chloride channel homolog